MSEKLPLVNYVQEGFEAGRNETVQLLLNNYVVPMVCPSFKSSDIESAHVNKKVMSSIESRKM